MTNPPYTPTDFSALSISEDESFCSALKKMLKLAVYTWKMVKWKYSSTGVLSDDYKFLLCQTFTCPPPVTTITTTTTV